MRREASQEPKFLTDSMHGKLSHWLRMLGYDTLYYPRDDDEILKKASEEGRIVLTSDTELHRRILSRGGASILLPLNKTETHLSRIAAYVKENYGTPYEEFLKVKFKRCSLCNGPLQQATSSRWRCETCGQEFWVGGHWRNISGILARVKELVNGLGKD
ncbi:MAG: Mut7-C RNAse domain-containing protein [Nitrososphaerota archaeon]|nr:Mut7-C RNAse domain-containing protein [Candidatus Calditenuaceae archaeon]MDW8072871.1 Mut7-C RNAse domain-containing protein [Nitrososphaerota archaeon]